MHLSLDNNILIVKNVEELIETPLFVVVVVVVYRAVP